MVGGQVAGLREKLEVARVTGLPQRSGNGARCKRDQCNLL
jgi:hypothetical protein